MFAQVAFCLDCLHVICADCVLFVLFAFHFALAKVVQVQFSIVFFFCSVFAQVAFCLHRLHFICADRVLLVLFAFHLRCICLALFAF